MMITDQDTLEECCAQWAEAEFITVDTEFLREKTYYPRLCLIQIAAPGAAAAAIDPLAEGIDLAPVVALLQTPDITKVFHAARQDLEIFHQLCDGVIPAPIFDTQIAAMVLGYGEQAGYQTLVHKITGGLIDKGAQFTDWSRRPLSEKQINYAIADVTHLIDVYQHLLHELAERGRAHWMEEEDAALIDPASYDADPNAAWERIKIRNPKPKNLAVLRALAAWREKKARSTNRPRGWILRDEVLAELALRLPTTADEISAMRGIPASLKEGPRAERMLGRIKDALATPKADWPRPCARKPMPQGGAERLELLKMLRKIHAARLGVAPRLLASTDDLEALAREGEDADIPLLSGWRREASGDDMLALSAGRLAIGLHKGAVAAIDLDEK